MEESIWKDLETKWRENLKILHDRECRILHQMRSMELHPFNAINANGHLLPKMSKKLIYDNPSILVVLYSISGPIQFQFNSKMLYFNNVYVNTTFIMNIEKLSLSHKYHMAACRLCRHKKSDCILLLFLPPTQIKIENLNPCLYCWCS